ncbi:MAG UNVERIFIED_CONTAM: hypothetical protein LVR29_04850 [Microcystis novacekii LVE1205-3]
MRRWETGDGRRAVTGGSPDEKIFTPTDERGFLPHTPHPTSPLPPHPTPHTLFQVRRLQVTDS